ncbi:MAG: hypothetical protein CMJ64_14265, partial [Planctomycetaceae bacterium]|nr:hypothetical protein [Planctomycetaceae bacterium]
RHILLADDIVAFLTWRNRNQSRTDALVRHKPKTDEGVHPTNVSMLTASSISGFAVPKGFR